MDATSTSDAGMYHGNAPHPGVVSYTLLTCSGSLVMPKSIFEMRHVQNFSGSGRLPMSLYLYQAIVERAVFSSSKFFPRLCPGGKAD